MKASPEKAMIKAGEGEAKGKIEVTGVRKMGSTKESHRQTSRASPRGRPSGLQTARTQGHGCKTSKIHIPPPPWALYARQGATGFNACPDRFDLSLTPSLLTAVRFTLSLYTGSMELFYFTESQETLSLDF
jgi:hypothetical protein